MSTNKSDMGHLGKKLRELRRERQLSQDDVSKGTGIPRRQYSRYELGTSIPSLPLLKKIVDFLGITYDAILSEKDMRGEIQDSKLWEFFQKVDELPYTKKMVVMEVLDSIIQKEEKKAS